MPETDNLETNRFSSDATAFDPFGLLTEDERAHVDRIVAADPTLPLPGTVLPLTWTPTPPPAGTAAHTPTDPNHPVCGNCRARVASWVVLANNNWSLDRVGLRPGTPVCSTCWGRRVRYSRYRWATYRGGCQGTGSLDASARPVSVVRVVPLRRQDTLSRYLVAGANLCNSCDSEAVRHGIRTVRIR